MGTSPHVSAPRTAAWLAGLAALLTACGASGNNVASHSPSPVPSSSTFARASASPSSNPSPQPVTGAYGVLYGSQAASTYTVSIIGIDGTVIKSTDASTPPIVSCANAAGAPVSPPVSMSDSQVYFMDASGAVDVLSPTRGRAAAPITTLPSPTASRRSMFAVSPDDSMIAVIVNDYTASGANTKLYVNQTALGAQNLIFSETGARTLWPIGWHGTNNLVLAVVPSCTQGGGPFCCGVQELHVVDPATATRRFTLGGITSCPIVGSPSPAGVVCWDGANSRVLNWTAGVVRTYPVQGPEQQLLSPNGSHVALVDNTGTVIQDSGKSIPNLFACTWVDDSHVLAGGDPQHQPRLADVTSGSLAPVAAQGDCAGRLPGGL